MIVALVSLFVLLHNEGVGASWCKTLNNYDNGLPFGVKKLDNEDNFGRTWTIIHKLFYFGIGGNNNFTEPPSTSGYCDAQGIIFGQFAARISMMPIGCCTKCCQIDKIEKFIQFYGTNKRLGGKIRKMPFKLKAGNLKRLGFDNKAKTVIYASGFAEYSLGLISKTLINAYFQRNESYNFVIIDWSRLASLPWYGEAVDNTKIVAQITAKMILYYDKTGEMPIENLHLLGMSLGAHICGFIGKIVGKVKKVPRITGFDPAFPLHLLEEPTQRLSADDAEYVDIIHTDHGKLGYPYSIGQADFYPNYERSEQPPCGAFKNLLSRRIEDMLVCDHVHSAELFAESIKNPYAFPATKMENINKGSTRTGRFANDAYMGFIADKSTKGDFYLSTKNAAPFGKSAEEQVEYIKSLDDIS